MADFRKWTIAFAVLALLVIGLAPASAQSFSCTANAATNPLVRSEGLTELVGDIVLNCTGGTSTPTDKVIPVANITVFLSTPITSRLVGANGLSEALLLIDDPQPGSQRLCTVGPGTTCAAAGPGAGAGAVNPFGPTGSAANVYQGYVSGQSVTFLGVPIEPPGTTFGTRVFRITNLRTDANLAGAGVVGVGQVTAVISTSPALVNNAPPTTFPVLNTGQVVALVKSGLTFSVGDAASLLQCNGADLDNTVPVDLKFEEGFPTAFKTRSVAPYISSVASGAPPVGTLGAADGNGVALITPSGQPGAQDIAGTLYNSESGLILPVEGTVTSPVAGRADFGTRLKAVFNNVPAGVNVWVATTNSNISEPAAGATPPQGTVASLTAGEVGAFATVGSTDTAGGTDVYQVPIVSGTGTAVWEVLADNPFDTETFTIPVFFTATPNVASNLPGIGTATVNGSLAPNPSQGAFTSTAGAQASSTLPIPRFVDTSTPMTILKVSICQTNLLFPFVTNQLGFDTGMAIANTSMDPFGTGTQAGTCDLNFYGANAPSVVTTPTVDAGTVYTTLASSDAPNFQGYVIAVCNFQYAHGFAFISDVGARNLAMGYLALVLPDRPPVFPENLNQ